MQFPDYPFESHFMDIRGHKLHYLDEGPGDAEPVVMLHGNPTWSFYYRKLVSALRDEYRCIVPDHIGMGLSDKPSAAGYDFHFTQRADDLAELLEQLAVYGNITLVLHDWGGMIGMAWAELFPGAVKRLVILNTAAFHLPKGKKLPVALRLGRIPFINQLLIQGQNAFSRGTVKYCVTRKPLADDVAAAYLAPYDTWTNRLAVRRFVEDIPVNPGDRGYEVVGRVAAGLDRYRDLPVLVCWGMRDFVFDKSFLDVWRTILPDAVVHRIRDAGHLILEDAGDEIVPLVKRFLASHPV